MKQIHNVVRMSVWLGLLLVLLDATASHETETHHSRNCRLSTADFVIIHNRILLV